MRASTVLLVACGIALAGCAGDGDSMPTAGSDPERVVQETTVRNLTFGMEGVMSRQAFEGSFQPSDAGAFQGPASAATGSSSALRLHELDLPPSLSFVQASLTPDDGRFLIWVQASDPGHVWTFDCLCQGTASAAFEAAIAPGADAQLAVFYVGSSAASAADDADGADYEVEVSISSSPQAVPSGVALGVELQEPGSTVTFLGNGSDVPEVLVFDPDDVFLGTLAAGPSPSFSIDANATAGEYAFLPSAHGARFAVQVEVPDGAATDGRVLEQVVETPGPWAYDGGPGEEQSWTETALRRPVQAVGCMGGTAGQSPRFTLDMPDGRTLEGALDGPQPTGYGLCAFTVVGDPALEAGDYTMRYQDAASQGAGAQLFLIYIGR